MIVCNSFNKHCRLNLINKLRTLGWSLNGENICMHETMEHLSQILIEVDELPETKYPISHITEEEEKE